MTLLSAQSYFILLLSDYNGENIFMYQNISTSFTIYVLFLHMKYLSCQLDLSKNLEGQQIKVIASTIYVMGLFSGTSF